MKLLGEPFSIQNTDEGWLVTWHSAVRNLREEQVIEAIDFTVLIPKNAALSISEVQTFALKRAAELLQHAIAHRQTP